jgi:hypothetical protein
MYAENQLLRRGCITTPIGIYILACPGNFPKPKSAPGSFKEASFRDIKALKGTQGTNSLVMSGGYSVTTAGSAESRVVLF